MVKLTDKTAHTHAIELLEIACEIMQWPTPMFKIKEQEQKKSRALSFQVKCSIRWKETGRDIHCINCAKNEAVSKILKYLVGRPGMALTFRQLPKENKPISFDTVKSICETNGLGTAQLKCSFDSPFYVASCVLFFYKAKKLNKNEELARRDVSMVILKQMPEILFKTAVNILTKPMLRDSRLTNFSTTQKSINELMSMEPSDFENESLNHTEFLNYLMFEQGLREMYCFYFRTTSQVDCKCTIRIPGSGETIEEQSHGMTKKESIANVSKKILYKLWERKTM